MVLRLQHTTDHIVEVEVGLQPWTVCKQGEYSLVSEVGKTAHAKLWFCHTVIDQLRGKDAVDE